MTEKELTGALFKNNRTTNEKSPAYKGSCLIGGVEYWISAWINTGKNEQKYMALRFEKKEPKQEKVNDALPKEGADDIPF